MTSEKYQTRGGHCIELVTICQYDESKLKRQLLLNFSPGKELCNRIDKILSPDYGKPQIVINVVCSVLPIFDAFRKQIIRALF